MVQAERPRRGRLDRTALTRLWFAWDRVEGDPEPYARRILVTTHASWWRRRWWSERVGDRPVDGSVSERPLEPGMDLWEALGHLPPRQRAKAMRRLRADVAVAPASEETAK